MEFERGSVLRRIGAFLFDHFLCSLMGMIAAVLYSNWLPMEGTSSMTIALSVTFGLFFFRDLVKGISPGRWVAGIMVRDNDDPSQIPSIPKRLLRNIMHVLWPVEALTMLFDREFRRLGDKAANSVVVLNPHRAKVGFRLIPVILLIICFISFTFLFAVFGIKSSEPYKASVAYVEESTEAKEITGGINGFGTIPAGKISYTNGEGEAWITLHVKGEKRDVIAELELDLVDDKWVVKDCIFR